MHPIEEELKRRSKELLIRGVDKETISVYMKELLQDYMLDALFHTDEGKDLVFYGGTALRKLFDLNRLSEDLDFEHFGKVDIEKLSNEVLTYFYRNNQYKNITAKTQSNSSINRITFKFPILKELGLSEYENGTLHLKVEVKDQSQKYRTELTPLLKANMTILVRHYPIEILMAGKILACLTRTYRKGASDIYIKGRDFYDLIWYMQQGITPDEGKLSEYKNGVTVSEIFLELDSKVKLITPKDLSADLEFLFEDREFIKDWCTNFHRLYSRFRPKYSV